MNHDAARLRPEDLLAHAGWIRDLARTLVRDAAAADDLVQETWVAALQHRPATDRPLRPWLASVLRAQAALGLRRAGHRARREEAGAREERLPSAAELVERAETQRRLVDLVLALDEPYRSVVLLRYYEGLQPADIARHRGVPGATIRSQLHRGLEQVRERLDQQQGGDRHAWRLALLPLVGLKLTRPPVASRPLAEVASAAGAGPAAVLAGLALAATALLLLGPRSDRSDHVGAAAPTATVPTAEVEPNGDPDSTRLALAPAAAPAGPAAVGRVEGRVVDARSGAELPWFELVLTGADDVPRRVSTDGHGAFALDLEGPPGNWSIALEDHPRLRDREGSQVHGAAVSAAVPTMVRELPAQLVLAAEVGPTYALDLEAPAHVQRTELRAHLRSSANGAYRTRTWQMHMAPVRTRPDGAAWVRFAPVRADFLGAGPWTLEVLSRDGLWSGEAEVPSIAGEASEAISLRLDARACVTGRVSDEEGPLAGQALVRLVPLASAAAQPAGASRDGERIANIDAQGDFAFRWVAPGEYRAVLESVQHFPRALDWSLKGAVDEVVDVSLRRRPRGGPVRGTLASRSGELDASSLVLMLVARAPDGPRLMEMARAGDSQVRFEFSDVPAGEYDLSVFSTRDARRWKPGGVRVTPPALDLHFERLDDERASDVGFRVLDDETGEPLAATVRCAPEEGPTFFLKLGAPGADGVGWSLVYEGFGWAQGRGFPQVRELSQASALRWSAFAPGYRPAHGDARDFVEREGGSAATVRLRRGWGARIEARAEGQPLAGVEVLLDGAPAGVTDATGGVWVEAQEAPADLQLERSGRSLVGPTPDPAGTIPGTQVRWFETRWTRP